MGVCGDGWMDWVPKQSVKSMAWEVEARVPVEVKKMQRFDSELDHATRKRELVCLVNNASVSVVQPEYSCTPEFSHQSLLCAL